MTMQVSPHSATLARQLRRAGAKWQVQFLAWIAQITQLQRLYQQHPRGVRPHDDPQPVSGHLTGERRAALGIDVPQRKLVMSDLDNPGWLAVCQVVARIVTVQPGEPGAAAAPRLL